MGVIENLNLSFYNAISTATTTINEKVVKSKRLKDFSGSLFYNYRQNI